MLRIYLDWNIISNLKRDENKDLKRFIDQNKDNLLFPYSPAHFKDLMKSYSPLNIHFNEDLEMLEYLSQDHLMIWEDTNVYPKSCDPYEYFERQKDNFTDISIAGIWSSIEEMSNESHMTRGFIDIMKSIFKLIPIGFEINEQNKTIIEKMFPGLSPSSSMWDLMQQIPIFGENILKNRDFYLNLRKALGDTGAKIDVNSKNWRENDVIDNIGLLLTHLGGNITFMESVESIFKFQNKKANRIEFFMRAYSMLDMFGYKSDKLPKQTDNFQNIQTDGEHAFFAAHCDYFVTADKKLRAKAQALYKKLNISTVILSPDEFISMLEKGLYTYPNDAHSFIFDAISFLKKENTFPISDIYKEFSIPPFSSPPYYCNYFNSACLFKDDKNHIILFCRQNTNYSNFIFCDEMEVIIKSLTTILGLGDEKSLDDILRKFLNSALKTKQIWVINNTHIILQFHRETAGLSLIIALQNIE